MEHSAACGIMVVVDRRLFQTFSLKPTLLQYLSISTTLVALRRRINFMLAMLMYKMLHGHRSFGVARQ